ncbi:winged helix-turn-helix domain-containing protein [Methanolapillus ohkumae]|uniref:Methanogenesis regulatory protein FilR1 middle domain-containing protein n=1 Tax=Methanolapillus ohkumae TaxID=3028298 RepID=A0AA96V881_9EURY|nr:hypothetical protein MsAm2_14440 [Methanosarcinaceae archaeon Am2]
MTTELIGTLFLSEKRKNVLIFLLSGPKDIDEIKIELNVNTSALMTQMKILMDQGLIVYSDNLYSLSVMGSVIVQKMLPLLNMLDTYSENKTYWSDHKLSAIPSDLLDRMDELRNCVLVEPELHRLYELPLKFEENLFKSAYIREISSFFSPSYHSAYLELARKGTEISIIIPVSVFDRFSHDYPFLLEEYLSRPNAKIYVYEKPIEMASSVVTDHFFSFSLFNNNGVYHNHSMMSFEESSIQWGEKLFQYYLERSKEMKLGDLKNI